LAKSRIRLIESKRKQNILNRYAMNYTKLLLSVVALSQVSLSAFPALKDKEIHV
jgi:hypothetical protein